MRYWSSDVCSSDLLGVLHAGDPEVGLLVGGAEDVSGGEELATVQALSQVEDAGALHHRVVDVEERRSRGVTRHVERRLDLRAGCSCLAGQLRTELEVKSRRAALVGHVTQTSGRGCGSIGS